jgi:hypothetical protein
LTTGRVYVGT